jgi:polysaccharide biosynthesis protein PslH
MTGATKRILFVSPVPTDPANAGNRVRIKTLAAWLTSAGHEVHFAYLPMEAFDLPAMQQRFGADHLHVLRSLKASRPGDAVREFVRKIGRRLNVDRAFVWRLDDWYNEAANAELAALHAQHRFDAVFVEYVFVSKALLAFPPECLRILDTHDCFALRHRTYLNAGLRPRWFSTSMADEEAGFRRADIVLAIQSSEARDFAARVKGSTTRVLQVGHLIDIAPPAPPSDREAAVFVGSSNPINAAGARYFIEHVLPIVRRSRPGFELVLAGSVSAEIDDVPGVRKLGFVANLSDAFAAAMVAVNPVQAGTGVNIKLLDAMAAGMPIVTTASGSRGLQEFEGRAFEVVGDADAHAFAASVLRLLDDERLRQHLAVQARAAATQWNDAQVGVLSSALAGRVMDGCAPAASQTIDDRPTMSIRAAIEGSQS